MDFENLFRNPIRVYVFWRQQSTLKHFLYSEKKKKKKKKTFPGQIDCEYFFSRKMLNVKNSILCAIQVSVFCYKWNFHLIDINIYIKN